MYFLAIYNLPEDRTALAPALASVLGITSYETSVRLRVPGSGPLVIATFGERVAAEGANRKLEASGLTTVMISDEENTGAQKEFPVRTFRFNGHALHAESRQREALAVDYQKIFLIIRGTGIKQETSTETTTEQKFDIGKAILTGGLIMSKTVKTIEQKIIEEREGFLFVYAEGVLPLVFREGLLDYSSLGPALQPSSLANFTTLLAEIRRRSPHARFDDRLTSKAGQVQLLGPLLDVHRYIGVAIELLVRVLR
ncbi:MAG: hypothetical protein FD156_2445 [Nitrospirae bacterium]|nr:MAG: hypothetical protein FD156_2445 [Nitrospirota bacterium]